ncbi:unnamed protein product, partial [Meganyctiphanes norvegica]
MELKNKSARISMLVFIGALIILCYALQRDDAIFQKNNSHAGLKLSSNLTKIQDLPNIWKQRRMWPDDPECERFTVGFSSGLPQVWLASSPRSGNSWTRYLIEAATGVYTNSIYHDKIMTKLGYYGEKEAVGTGRCMATKTHLTWQPGDDHHSPTILLIRNPAKLVIIPLTALGKTTQPLKLVYLLNKRKYEQNEL